MAQLPFLAVGRVEDSTTLASFCPDSIAQAEQRDTEDVFKKLLTAAGKKLRHGEKTRLQWNDGSVCCVMDQNKVLLYCVVTSDLQYPERLAYGMLTQLMTIVNNSPVAAGSVGEQGLTNHIRDDMRTLLEKYEDNRQWDSILNALNKVSSANTTMKDNINAVGANQDGIKGMQARADQMSSSGQMFAQEGRDLDSRYRSKNRVIGLLVIVVVVVVIGFFAFGRSGSDSSTAEPSPAPAAAPTNAPTEAPAAEPDAAPTEDTAPAAEPDAAPTEDTAPTEDDAEATAEEQDAEPAPEPTEDAVETPDVLSYVLV